MTPPLRRREAGSESSWGWRLAPTQTEESPARCKRTGQRTKPLPEGYDMNTSEVLNRAADLIERRGWRSGPDGWEGERLCLEGGILAALNIPAELRFHQGFHTCPAYLAVTDYLGRHTHFDEDGFVVDALWKWNDEWDTETGERVRTATEVIEVLRACAVIEAAREEQDAAWETYAEQVSA